MSLSRDQLIALVSRVQSASACVMDFDALLVRLERAFPGVDVGRWIFDPPDGRPRSPDELVDHLLQGSDASQSTGEMFHHDD